MTTKSSPISSDVYEQISVRHILEELAYSLASSEVWGADSKIPQEMIQKEREHFRLRAQWVVSFLSGTRLIPIGTPVVEYRGIFLPQNLKDELETGFYHPKWFKGNEV